MTGSQKRSKTEELVVNFFGGKVVEAHILINPDTGERKLFYKFGIDQVRVDTEHNGSIKTQFLFRDHGRKLWKKLIAEGFVPGVDDPRGDSVSG